MCLYLNVFMCVCTDVRSSSVPIFTFAAHASSVSDVMFLPHLPSVLYSSSSDGSICSLNFNGQAPYLDPIDINYTNQQATHHLLPTKQYHTSLAVNTLSFETDSQTIVAGTDTEQLWFAQMQ